MSVKMNKEAFQKLIDDDILGLHETMRAGCVRDHIENILKDSARVYYDLAEAIEAVYFAAHWHADRTVDAAALWTALRDAAEIQPGQTKARLGEDRLPGPNYRQLIEEHNSGCEASCKAQRPVDSESTGCGYQRPNGDLIYGSRNCPNCPQDWKIELPLPATGSEGSK